MRRAVIFNYDSIFADDIVKTILKYNGTHPEEAFSINMYKAGEYAFESLVGFADFITHSGGDGLPVEEDLADIPKLYICHSHQWKAEKEGGQLVKLKDFVQGVRFVDVLEDDEILGRKGKMPIMQYHMLAVARPPRCARVLATSRAVDIRGKEIETIEALRYPNGSIGIQGHPEEGTAEHIFYNFFQMMNQIKYAKQYS